MTVKTKLPRLKSGKLPSYTWPGGYPLYYVTQDGVLLCSGCANNAKSEGLTDDSDDPLWFVSSVNWEDEGLYCDHCSKRIESAYGDD